MSFLSGDLILVSDMPDSDAFTGGRIIIISLDDLRMRKLLDIHRYRLHQKFSFDFKCHTKLPNNLKLVLFFYFIYFLVFPIGKHVMYLERECDEEEYPSKRREDRDIPVLLLAGSYCRRGFFRRDDCCIHGVHIAAEFLHDRSQIHLIAEL